MKRYFSMCFMFLSVLMFSKLNANYNNSPTPTDSHTTSEKHPKINVPLNFANDVDDININTLNNADKKDSETKQQLSWKTWLKACKLGIEIKLEEFTENNPKKTAFIEGVVATVALLVLIKLIKSKIHQP